MKVEAQINQSPLKMSSNAYFRSRVEKEKKENRHLHSTMQLTTVPVTFLLLLLLLLATFLLHVPSANAKNEKVIVITNNHTNFLSVRCFSFDNDFDVVHLPSWGEYKFRVTKRVFYPSSTMFNCSTNMGTFVAYKYNYECSADDYETCDWRFDEESAYRWEPKSNDWVAYDYAPNYESLSRGGVIKGYFAN